MSPTALILLFLIIANVPWLTERVFLVFSISATKSVLVRLIELVVFYFVSLLIAIGVEMQFSGDVYPQSWEFFVTTFCLFLVLAVPGVVYRYQWLPMSAKLK
ncbi:MAG: DUF2818 domain-containing protein [Gammaproteobacteria bacterium]|nr:MAG: DUF2818 domain-containing protein [Gammaproteobacteria bacterium]